MTHLGANLWAYILLMVALVVAAVWDVRKGKIPNWITYPAILAGFIGHLIVGGLLGVQTPDGSSTLGLVGSLAGFAIGFFPMLGAWLSGGIGGGDAKLMGAVGALGGWQFALSSLFYGLLVAVVWAIWILIRRKVVRQTFGRLYLFMTSLLLKAKPDDPATPDSPRMALGMAFCIGALIVLVLTAVYGPERSLFLLGI